jgi:beta-glucosidase
MTQPKPAFSFPKKFLWGASVSPHQSEGGTHNQWSVWELENAKSLAAQAQYQYHDLESWESIKEEACNPDTYVSGRASDHYTLYEQDFEYVSRMGMNAFRFGVEWSRIEPEEGVWNAEAIEHYKQYIASLQKREIEPVVTLFHYTMPIWFAKMGGFEKRRNVKYFTRFAEKIVSELGTSIKLIITINEIEVYVLETYMKGQWPPNKHSIFKAFRVTNNLIYAHKQATAAIHKLNRRYKVSIAKNSAYYYAGDDAFLSRKTAQLLQYIQDDYILKRVAKHCDFIGLNYYLANRVYGYRIHNPDERVSDLGWDLNPAALQQALERLHDKYGLPILITENGLADARDEDRKWWLTHTLLAMQRAMEYGVDLQGYLHWSLLDNFEWDKGRWPRFGLLEVDYETLKRTPRPSAIWFAGIIKKIRSQHE